MVTIMISASWVSAYDEWYLTLATTCCVKCITILLPFCREGYLSPEVGNNLPKVTELLTQFFWLLIFCGFLFSNMPFMELSKLNDLGKNHCFCLGAHRKSSLEGPCSSSREELSLGNVGWGGQLSWRYPWFFLSPLSPFSSADSSREFTPIEFLSMPIL